LKKENAHNGLKFLYLQQVLKAKDNPIDLKAAIDKLKVFGDTVPAGKKTFNQ